MIGADEIGEIIATYEKHGWMLRRVLLSTELKKQVGGDISRFVSDARIIASDINAVWFSRPPKPGRVAWEIRHLAETPYALLENVDENSPDFEDTLQAVESRLRETALKAKSA